ncbi:MAG: 30S ribosome-binding factor RbfA [Planctomycetes bacterium]|nr:30S ribosome-binding factor RbfA [Planctomycetota bacterium]
MADERRLLRIASRLKQDLSTEILYKLKDPRIGFVTIASVKVAKDLSIANIGISVMGSEGQKNAAIKALTDAAGYLQNQLAPKYEMRTFPRLKFRLDESVERAFKITKLIDDAVRDLPADESEEIEEIEEDADDDEN